jgi:hypothetical protein
MTNFPSRPKSIKKFRPTYPKAIDSFLPLVKNKRRSWTRQQLQGYLSSWSSVQNFLKEYPDSDPVQELIDELIRYWTKDEEKAVRFPTLMRIGKIKK